MTRKKLENMSVDELEKRNQELMRAKADIRKEQLAVNEQLAIAQARERVADMPSAEREALKQAIKAEGIEDDSEVGTPG